MVRDRHDHYPDCASHAGYGCTCADVEYDVWAKEESARIDVLAKAWKAQWPHHCTRCLGRGGNTFYQNHPYGMGSAAEQMWDICDNCVGNGMCPRCARVHDDEWEGDKCVECGWDCTSAEASCPVFEM